MVLSETVQAKAYLACDMEHCNYISNTSQMHFISNDTMHFGALYDAVSDGFMKLCYAVNSPQRVYFLIPVRDWHTNFAINFTNWMHGCYFIIWGPEGSHYFSPPRMKWNNAKNWWSCSPQRGGNLWGSLEVKKNPTIALNIISKKD